MPASRAARVGAVQQGLPYTRRQHERLFRGAGVDQQQKRRLGAPRLADQAAQCTCAGVAPGVALQGAAIGLQPGQVVQAQRIGEPAVPVLVKRLGAAAQRHQACRECHQVVVGFGPVDPGGGVVLVVGVVVAALGVPGLGAGAQHGGTLGQHGAGEERALQLAAHGQDGRVAGRAFDATIVAEVVAVAVAVVLTVGEVAAFVVAHQVAQREAIMRHDVVDRFRR